MVPLVDKYYYYLYSDFRDTDNLISFVQLVAHADKTSEIEGLSAEKKLEITRNRKLCDTFYEHAWSSRDGLVHFVKDRFANKEQTLAYYGQLSEIAKEHRCNNISYKIII